MKKLLTLLPLMFFSFLLLGCTVLPANGNDVVVHHYYYYHHTVYHHPVVVHHYYHWWHRSG